MYKCIFILKKIAHSFSSLNSKKSISILNYILTLLPATIIPYSNYMHRTRFVHVNAWKMECQMLFMFLFISPPSIGNHTCLMVVLPPQKRETKLNQRGGHALPNFKHIRLHQINNSCII